MAGKWWPESGSRGRENVGGERKETRRKRTRSMGTNEKEWWELVVRVVVVASLEECLGLVVCFDPKETTTSCVCLLVH